MNENREFISALVANPGLTIRDLLTGKIDPLVTMGGSSVSEAMLMLMPRSARRVKTVLAGEFAINNSAWPGDLRLQRALDVGLLDSGALDPMRALRPHRLHELLPAYGRPWLRAEQAYCLVQFFDLPKSAAWLRDNYRSWSTALNGFEGEGAPEPFSVFSDVGRPLIPAVADPRRQQWIEAHLALASCQVDERFAQVWRGLLRDFDEKRPGRPDGCIEAMRRIGRLGLMLMSARHLSSEN